MSGYSVIEIEKIILPTKLPNPFESARVDAWGQSADQWRSRRA